MAWHRRKRPRPKQSEIWPGLTGKQKQYVISRMIRKSAGNFGTLRRLERTLKKARAIQ